MRKMIHEYLGDRRDEAMTDLLHRFGTGKKTEDKGNDGE